MDLSKIQCIKSSECSLIQNLEKELNVLVRKIHKLGKQLYGSVNDLQYVVIKHKKSF